MNYSQEILKKEVLGKKEICRKLQNLKDGLDFVFSSNIDDESKKYLMSDVCRIILEKLCRDEVDIVIYDEDIFYSRDDIKADLIVFDLKSENVSPFLKDYI